MNIEKLSIINYTPIRNNPNNKNINFGNSLLSKGYAAFTDKIASDMGKVLNSESIIKFSEKYHNTNIADYIFKASGVLLSSFVMFRTLTSDKIDKKRRKPLALNTGISCVLVTSLGIAIDKMLNPSVKRFGEYFKKVNPNIKNIDKLVDGINVTKSAILFATLARFIIPVASTVFAEKASKSKIFNSTENKLNKNA